MKFAFEFLIDARRVMHDERLDITRSTPIRGRKTQKKEYVEREEDRNGWCGR